MVMVMTTSFVRHEINMEIHDVMCHVSQKLNDTIELMVHNKVQCAMKFATKRASFGEFFPLIQFQEFNGTKTSRCRYTKPTDICNGGTFRGLVESYITCTLHSFKFSMWCFCHD